MNADDFPIKELEIQFYGGRLDGKKIRGMSAVNVIRDSAENDFLIRCNGANYHLDREGVVEDGKAYMRAYAVPPLIPR